MVLPSAPNSIACSQLQSEMGGVNPVTLSEYYANNSYALDVPGVPTTGKIDLSLFRGKSKVTGLLNKAEAGTQTACKLALSTKLVNINYTGPIFQLRRSTDNVTQNFYVNTTGSYVGTSIYGNGTSATSWLNGAIGYVTTWYDQTGNGNHVSQANSAKQPYYSNGKIIFTYDLGTFLEKSYNSALNTNTYTYFAVCTNYGGAADYQSVLTSRQGSPVGGYIIYRDPSNIFQQWHGVSTGWSSLATNITCTPNVKYKISGQYNGATLRSTINGTATSTSMTLTLNTTFPFRIGGGATETADGRYFWQGDITEIMYFNTMISDTEVTNLFSYL